MNYYTASVGFANLTHSMAPFWTTANPDADAWGVESRNFIFGVGAQSRLSMLGIQGSWDPINIAFQNQNVTEYGIAEDYRVRYKVTVYWEGSEGKAQVIARGGGSSASDSARENYAFPPQTAAAYSPTTVQFANGDPFGEGVTRNFYKRTTEFGPVSVRGLKDHNCVVYANGPTDRFRNPIILVHDVQREVGSAGSNVWETVYAGVTHQNYTPFALYPTYVEAMKHAKALRYLQFEWAHKPEGNTSQSTGEAITGLNYPYTDSWIPEQERSWLSTYHDLPPAFGSSWGFAALNRPTHALFGRSLRAACEICSALGCDLWWNHPFHTTYVGNTPGEIKVREAYFQMFAETVNQHLAPGLKVYSEWGNETWNSGTTYIHGRRYAQNQSLKLTNSDGDLVLRDYSSAWSSNPPWWANTADNQNVGMFAYNAVAAAAISGHIRPLMPGREIVSVWAAQDGQGVIANWIRQASFALWETVPWVFDELDAYAVAPYRTPPVDNAAVENGTLTTAGAFDAVQGAGWLIPASDPSSKWATEVGGKPGFIRQKQFALDLVADPNPGLSFAMPDEQDKRRWNLSLIAYECGQHAIPNTNATKDFTRRLQYEPRYYDFYYRHYETLLSPGPAPMTTTRQPDGYFGSKSQFIANGEPLYDLVTDLSLIGPHGYANSGNFWGTQQFNGEIGAPRAQALRGLIRSNGQ